MPGPAKNLECECIVRPLQCCRESARDDGTFLLTTAAVILLPAIAILLVAYFTGYLDRLSDPYSTSSF